MGNLAQGSTEDQVQASGWNIGMILHFTSTWNTGGEGEFGSEDIMFDGLVGFLSGAVQQKFFTWNKGAGEMIELEMFMWEPKAH